MPMTLRPGIVATRADIADMLRAISSASWMTRLALIPGAGSSSYIVTTGPGRTSVIAPFTWKSSSTVSSSRALRSSAALSSACPGAGGAGVSSDRSGSTYLSRSARFSWRAFFAVEGAAWRSAITGRLRAGGGASGRGATLRGSPAAAAGCAAGDGRRGSAGIVSATPMLRAHTTSPPVPSSTIASHRSATASPGNCTRASSIRFAPPMPTSPPNPAGRLRAVIGISSATAISSIASPSAQRSSRAGQRPAPSPRHSLTATTAGSASNSATAGPISISIRSATTAPGNPSQFPKPAPAAVLSDRSPGV